MTTMNPAGSLLVAGEAAGGQKDLEATGSLQCIQGCLYACTAANAAAPGESGEGQRPDAA
ncbi:hypothetical protein [Brevundimonas sp.]|uniref:hypothetical protein n=1 Tax=Brevundimonas sp. TaxID=1871086 RepID=UPI0026213E31|nr:hypothetical protein [Brevundimonas sp.]